MTTPPQPTPQPMQDIPRMFGQQDYVLPAEVHTNLPRQDYYGQPPGWHRARGLLMELCQQLPATPVALYHRVLHTPIGNPDGVVVTAIVRDRQGEVVTVVWRRQLHPLRHGQQRGWQLTVNGITPPDGTGSMPPAPPWLARIACRVIEH